MSLHRQIGLPLTFLMSVTVPGRKFDDFRNAEAAGAVINADTWITELADRPGLPGEDLAQTLESVLNMPSPVRQTRSECIFRPQTLFQPPFAAVKVTGALFHTQGGLGIDDQARVIMQ